MNKYKIDHELYVRKYAVIEVLTGKLLLLTSDKRFAQNWIKKLEADISDMFVF